MKYSNRGRGEREKEKGTDRFRCDIHSPKSQTIFNPYWKLLATALDPNSQMIPDRLCQSTGNLYLFPGNDKLRLARYIYF